MKKSNFLLAVLGIVTVFGISACNNGGGSSPQPTPTPGPESDFPLLQCGGGSGGSTWNPNPYSCPSEGRYNGTLYSELSQPNQASNGVLSKQYPESYLPTYLFKNPNSSQENTNGLQIAYGRNTEANVAKIAAFVTMAKGIKEYICSATPVKYDAVSNKTYLIGAAHCFVDAKESATQLFESNLMTKSQLSVYYGVSGLGRTQYPVTAVFLRKDYCYGDRFTSSSECRNFSPTYGVSGGQGNDIAVIQISGEFGGAGNRVNYPEVVQASEYPATNSLAPILSIGYGINTQTPNAGADCGVNGSKCSTLYYVSGYQYATANTQNESGYHYLFNSFYSNQNRFYRSGYTALICGGDSGGGDLFWTGSKWILLSEHTYGLAGACGTFYNYLSNGATNVSSYYDWIMSIFNTAAPVTNCKNNIIANCVTNG